MTMQDDFLFFYFKMGKKTKPVFFWFSFFEGLEGEARDPPKG